MSVAGIGRPETCAHPGCVCLVDPGDRYCSEFCRGHPRLDDTKPGDPPRYERPQRCGCGHSACDEPRV
jgi:hypothetical protein